MRMKIKTRRTRRCRTRQGAAAVETAIVTPLLVLLFLGAVDAGQYASCYQKVSDASREGARFAARFETTDAHAVRHAVVDYLADRFPGLTEAELFYVSQVTLRDELGNVLVGEALAATGSGSPVEVDVSLQFDSIRWIRGLQFLGGRNVQVASVMRRE